MRKHEEGTDVSTGTNGGTRGISLADFTGEEKKYDDKKKGLNCCGHFCKLMKEAKLEVTNIDNGVVVKVTSDNPKAVKQIQERWANCKEHHSTGTPCHGHKAGSAKYKGKHKSGKCTGHKLRESDSQ